MTAKTDRIPEPVMEQAADWMFQLEATPGDAAVQAGLSAWRAQSDLHERAWALAQKTWRVSGHARPASMHEWPDRPGRPMSTAEAASLAAPAAVPRVDGPMPARPHRRLVAALALAAGLAIVVGLPALQSRLSADYATATGETREVMLDDGSTVELAADSAIAATYDATNRVVTLLRGQAFFRVVADPRRVFAVTADNLTVSVTGTAFDVGLTDRTIAIAVASGAVRVARSGAARTGADPGPFELGPGQGLAVDRATGKAIETAVTATSVAAWRNGRLVVENRPMADVVEMIGRYHHGLIVMPNGRLRESRVTGVYDLQDPVRALRALSASYGGAVHEITPFLIVVSAD